MNLCKAFAHDDSADIFGDDSGLNVKKMSPDADHETYARIALGSADVDYIDDNLNVDVNIPHTPLLVI